MRTATSPHLKPLLAVAALGGLLACGLNLKQASEGTVSLSGTSSFAAHTAISSTVKGSSNMAFVLTDDPATCAQIRSRGTIPFIEAAVIGVVGSGQGQAVTARTYSLTADSGYQVVDGGYVVAVGVVAVKTNQGSINALSGSISITRTDDAGIAGSFESTFPDGGTLSGTFDAPRCDGLPI